ncbi:MAG TPA: TIR domain-containing protein [Anaerolineales bacterium]|nr:TIR domain-containing protein [Anaerolineales bacterium]
MADETENTNVSKTASLMISYSRKDKVFVKQLYDKLITQGFSPDDIWVDWEGIPLSADWMAEITKGIQASNVFIFVISPDSVASEVCRKEIEIAVESNKRFIPILHREPGKDVALHEKISSHNWVFIRDDKELEGMLPALVDAINTDLTWIAQHTRLFNRAKEWDAKGRNDSYLVRGSDLQDAETFISEGAAGKDPTPTPLHVEYVQAARKFAANVRRRNRIITALVGVALLALSIFALVQWQVAEETSRAANALALSAEAVNQKDSNTQLGLMLALLSIQETSQDDTVLLESESALFSSLNTPNVIHTWQDDGIIFAVAYDPNGRYVAMGNEYGRIRFMSLETYEEVNSTEFEGGISGLDFNHDGERLGVSTYSGTAIIVDVETGDEILTLAGHGGVGVNDIDFSQDGQWIATAGGDGLVNVWDANDGSLQLSLSGHNGGVNAVSFDSDSTRVVSGDDTNDVILWDLSTGSILNTFYLDPETRDERVLSVAFNPGGSRIMAGGYKTVAVWNVYDYSVIHRLRGNQSDIYSVGFSPDGLNMMTASAGVKIWDWAYGTERFDLSSHNGEVTSAVYSPDGKYLLTGSWDNTVKLWSANLKIETLRLTQHPDLNLDASYSSDGKWIVTSDGSGFVYVHDAKTGEVVHNYTVMDDEWINVAEFNPNDNQQFVTGDDTGQLQVWHLGDNETVWSIPAHDGEVKSASFSPDGSMVLSAGTDGAARLWDAQNGELIRELYDPNEGVIYQAHFSSDGEWIITATDSHIAQIWDAQTGGWILDLKGHTDEILTAIFSRDGQYAYTAGYDNTIRKWEASTGQELLVITGHTGRVLDLDISPDDALLVSGSADTTVKVWNVENGKQVFNYQGNSEDSQSVAFSPDGKRILTASLDNTSKEFTVDYDSLLQVAQEYELRPLTKEECQRFLYRDDCTLSFLGDIDYANPPSTSNKPSDVQADAQSDAVAVAPSTSNTQPETQNEPEAPVPGAEEIPALKSGDGDTLVALIFENNSAGIVDVNWIDFEGVEKVYFTLEPGDFAEQGTYSTHVWRVRDANGNILADYIVTEDPKQTLSVSDTGVSNDEEPDINEEPQDSQPVTGSLYTEEFDSDLSSSWDSFMASGEDRQVNAAYADGSLNIQLSPYDEKLPLFYVINSDNDYSSVQLELVTTNNGNNANGVSLVCQYSEAGWYEFTMSNSGFYSINAYDPTIGYIQLVEGGSSAINAGRSMNTYTAVCDGSNLTLVINGEDVAGTTDTQFNFSSGKIGFGVSFSPDDMLPVDVSIDTLTVSEP